MNARIPDNALPPKLDPHALQAFVDEKWDREIIPALEDYIAIPAKSPAFDADWAKNGYIDRVVHDAAEWVEAQKVSRLTLEVVRLPGRTPVIYFDAPATRSDNGDTVLMYGHLDKQPEFSGWRSDLGPWTPKYENDKLYGRGGADDGYAIYASLTAIMALDKQGIPRPR
ncbi:MAG TPA: M20/M25/M40 family metallo-hydrolase, partial [Candidimonas sp.]|nr:M20/M25/M40 family metallo-hydrolase [Candidimonas sp.]